MAHNDNEDRAFLPLNIAVLTVSDSRTEATDKSGALLRDRVEAAGHRLAEKAIEPDDMYRIRATVSRWIADPAVQVVLTTHSLELIDAFLAEATKDDLEQMVLFNLYDDPGAGDA